jgi:hypothetical protein
MAARKPQISFQVAENLKLVYEAANYLGAQNVTRLCAAGFLCLLENQDIRQRALSRLVEFETSRNSPHTQKEVEAYVQGLSDALQDKPRSQRAPHQKGGAKGRRSA